MLDAVMARRAQMLDGPHLARHGTGVRHGEDDALGEPAPAPRLTERWREPWRSVSAHSGVPGGQDEELVGGLIEEGGEAGHRVVPEMQVVDEAAEQLGHDHDVVLERLKPRDVEAGRGCVAGPHPESGVAGLLGRGGEFVTQIREQSPVIRRVRHPLLMR